MFLLLMADRLDLLHNGLNLPPRNRGPRLPLWMPVGRMAGVGASLIFLERLLDNHSLPDLPLLEAVLHLVGRFVLVTLLLNQGQAPLAVYMLYPVLLFAFFTFGRRVAYGIAFVSSIFVVLFALRTPLGATLSMPDLNTLFVYILGLLMVLLLANVLLDERETNHQLQDAHNNLADSHAKLQTYSLQVATMAATDERNRLARDIHDSLGHHLTAANIQLEKAGLFLERDLTQSATAIEHAQRTIRQALNEVRTSVQALREKASQFDLIPELRELISRMSHHNLKIDFRLTGDTAGYSTFVKMTIYRIVQEALTNIHKHARASETIIDLAFNERQAVLTIQDNGRGFDVDAVEQGGHTDHGRYGLHGIRERVALVGGRYTMTSEPGKGSLLSITAPKNNGILE